MSTGCTWFKTELQPPAVPMKIVDPVEHDFKKLLARDNRALNDISRWFENNRQQLKTDRSLQLDFTRLTRARLQEVRRAYRGFLNRHPHHARARAAYASFLKNVRDEQGAIDQWHRALKTNSGNAALWNNLATHLGTLALESGNTTTADHILDYFKRATDLAPGEPLYHNNYATALSLYRQEAAEHLQASPGKILRRSFEHFRKAHELAPSNFDFAADLAEAHLDIRPLHISPAMEAWKRARRLAKTPLQNQWVELQVAMLEIENGNPAAARRRLEKINEPSFARIKKKLITALNQRQKDESPRAIPQ